MTGARLPNTADARSARERRPLHERLDAFGSAACVMDEHGCIVAVSARAEELLGRPGRELIGHDAHDLLHRNRHGESVPRTQCRIRRAILAGRSAQGSLMWFERGDGSLLPVAWLVTPYDLGEPGPHALVLFHSPEDADLPGPEPERPVGPLPELERLALLAELTTQLTATLDTDEALRRLASLVVPRLADWAVIDLITERDEVWRSAVVHSVDGALVNQDDLEGPMPPIPEHSTMPLSRALRGAASALAGPEIYQGAPDSGIAVEQRRMFEATGIHSAAIAPIRGLREVLGALTLGRAERPEGFTTADLPLLEDITRRAGLALDNARLYQRQRMVAETMQRHLLPQLPRVPRLEMTVRYLSAPDASQVGGDWYDAFALADGSTALAIGDVVGHDLDAAAGMAQLRNMLRAYAWDAEDSPSGVVERLEQAAEQVAEVDLATLIFARIVPVGAAGWELSWTNAGHPPPLLIDHEGLSRYLTGGHGIMLGTGAGRGRPDATELLPPGATLLFYTDGLIETHGRSLDDGLDRLRRHAASLAHRSLDSFTDLLLSRTRPADNDDDVAILALRTPPEP
ncbi:SpoIIE family protein phosphatase [Streptomyces pactum]|uniref:SpoIIE family protein phosphatase n=1 Tax=Streptomyces pactum TaxID=68249 RepID=A0ABS0NF31_9ACTN|nr:SpoIIE family protein phosphatase [Streptomyces pactum]MBH5333802.1 SpoIIE family protein phosphatase [Streptomyces pactum]